MTGENYETGTLPIPPWYFLVLLPPPTSLVVFCLVYHFTVCLSSSLFPPDCLHSAPGGGLLSLFSVLLSLTPLSRPSEREGVRRLRHSLGCFSTLVPWAEKAPSPLQPLSLRSPDPSSWYSGLCPCLPGTVLFSSPSPILCLAPSLSLSNQSLTPRCRDVFGLESFHVYLRFILMQIQVTSVQPRALTANT